MYCLADSESTTCYIIQYENTDECVSTPSAGGRKVDLNILTSTSPPPLFTPNIYSPNPPPSKVFYKDTSRPPRSRLVWHLYNICCGERVRLYEYVTLSGSIISRRAPIEPPDPLEGNKKCVENFRRTVIGINRTTYLLGAHDFRLLILGFGSFLQKHKMRSIC